LQPNKSTTNRGGKVMAKETRDQTIKRLRKENDALQKSLKKTSTEVDELKAELQGATDRIAFLGKKLTSLVL
jgi:prefoldin subunit 5